MNVTESRFENRQLHIEDYPQMVSAEQKECTKNFGEDHCVHRGETFPKSESEENKRGSYQQSEIPWKFLYVQGKMQI